MIRISPLLQLKLASLILFFSSTGFAHKPNLRFEHLAIEDGLSHSKVNVVFQDSHGFMWFGTNDGIDRYNGYDIRIFKSDPITNQGLSYDLIRDIYEDKWGNLWVTTDAGGLNLYDYLQETFFTPDYITLTSDVLRNIVEDKEGNIWIGSDKGLNKINDRAKRVTHFLHDPEDENSIRSNDIQTIYMDSKNNLWLGFSNNGIDKFNIQTGQIEHISILQSNEYITVYRFIEDYYGRIWIGTRQSGVFVYYPSTKQIIKINGINGETIQTVRAFYRDNDSNIWIGSRLGLYIYSLVDKEIYFYDKTSQGELSLKHHSIQCIYEDSKGDIWIGTRNGLSFFDVIKEPFNFYTHVPHDSRFLNDDIVFSVIEDDDGDFLIGTENGGLNILNNKTKLFKYYGNSENNPHSISYDNIKTINKSNDGNFWIGTFNGGLNYFNKRTGKFKHYKHIPEDKSSIPHNDVYSIVEMENRDLWLATENGLSYFIRSKKTFKNYFNNPGDSSSLSHNSTKVVYKDMLNNIWIGTFAGLNLYDPDNDSFTRYMHNDTDSTTISNNYIQCIFEDSKGRFWIGTRGGGLNLMDRKTGKFKIITEKDGLANNTIYGILEDDSNYLWLSTNNGLSRFDPETKKFTNYTTLDGLLSNQFNYNCYFKGSNSWLYFGTAKGVVYFNPEKLKVNTFNPPVVFTDLYIFNKKVDHIMKDSPLEKPLWQTNHINLEAEQSVLTFEFAALNFASPENNQYQYRLDGFDKDWNYIGNNRTVTFTNLDPGDYTLRIKASNNHGVWNEEDRRLDIHIEPPWWLTWWFKVIIACLVIAAVFGSINFRTRFVTKRNRELESRVSKRTFELEQINKELESFNYSISHDLRTPLRSLSGYANILIEDYSRKLDNKGQNYLKKIHLSAIHMSQLIQDLLKLSRLTRNEMNIQPVNLSIIADSIINSYRSTLPDRKIDCRIESSLKVNGDKELLRIMLQNLYDNAIKYSSERSVSKIEFGKINKNGQLVFYLRDNGIGFDMSYSEKLFIAFERLQTQYSGTGIGLAIVKRVVEMHKGIIWAKAKPNEGATFYFKL